MQSVGDRIVLIVDDDPDVAAVLADLLQLEGFSVASALDGAAALAQLRDGLRPCAILLDLMMPVMDGWAFRADQLADPALAPIPVLVTSAGGFTREAITDQMGAVGYLPKPFSEIDFLAAIHSVCPGAG
jgi:CheY-like chemotaxis protein